MVNSKVTFTEKKPGGERMPEVPKHIEENAEDLSNIRLLVAESEIISYAIQSSAIATLRDETIVTQYH